MYRENHDENAIRQGCGVASEGRKYKIDEYRVLVFESGVLC